MSILVRKLCLLNSLPKFSTHLLPLSPLFLLLFLLLLLLVFPPTPMYLLVHLPTFHQPLILKIPLVTRAVCLSLIKNPLSLYPAKETCKRSSMTSQNQISLLSVHIPEQPTPAPVTSHAWYSSRETPLFLCFYCQEGAHPPARCSLLQEHNQANLVTHEKGTGYVLPKGSRISHDAIRPVCAAVLSHGSSK